MKLYCWPCRKVHLFTDSEVEQIVYALTGMLLAEETTRDRIVRVEARLICPREVLALAQDSECYLEHVEQGVARRRAG